MTIAEDLEALAAIFRERANPPGSFGGNPALSAITTLLDVTASQERRIADQERRLRVLEPCPKKALGGPHVWDLQGHKCEYCGVTK